MSTKIVVSSPEEQAKLAAGVDLAHVDHQVVDEVDPPAETPTETAPQASAATPEPESMSLVGYLKGEVAELKTALAEKDRQLAELSTQANAANLLGPIVIAAIHRLQVPLRQAPLQLAGLPPEVLARQYQQVWDQFMAQFPVGQKAQSEEDDSRIPTDPAEQRLMLVK